MKGAKHAIDNRNTAAACALQRPQRGSRPGRAGLLHDADDATLRAALARRYDCAAEDLAQYVIVREPQAIIVRPVAFYG